MCLNLRVYPLEVLEGLAHQKCLLPKHSFPKGIRPGTWAKCILHDETFTIAQIFPRDIINEQNYCYMDKCVSSGTIVDNDAHLEQLELLNAAAPIVSAIDVIFTITEKFLSTYVNSMHVVNLETATLLLLQPLKLTNVCTVRTNDMCQYGIHTLDVRATTACNANSFFTIDEDTHINIVDVKLYSPYEELLFHPFGFEGARKELQEFLRTALKQKTRERSAFHQAFNILLVGPSGCGKSTLASAFIRENNCNCFRIVAADVIGQYPGETEQKLRTIFMTALLFAKHLNPKSPTVILMEDLHLLCPTNRSTTTDSGNSMRICVQLLSLIDEIHQYGFNIFCIATTSAPEQLNEIARRPQRFDHEVEVNPLNDANRMQLFQALLNQYFVGHNLKHALDVDLLNIVAKQTQGYVVADLALLARNIVQAIQRDCNRSLVAAVTEALKKCRPISVRGTDIAVVRPEYNFDAIAGIRQLKRTLDVCILNALKRPASYRRFGLQLPKGVLLYGPPGCAKTTIAKCLATEANMNFIATSAAEVYSPYVGCAEKYIVKMFDTARKNAPCMIFFDEIDAIFGRRTMASNANDVQVRILSTLLTEMDGVVGSALLHDNDAHILVVAATNRPDKIDDALLRPGRFDKLIHVPAPDWQSRLQILELYSQRMPFAANVDLISIARQTINYSGADVCNICNEAAMEAMQRDVDTLEITADDFERVLRTQKSSLTQQQINWYLNFEKKFKK